MSVFRNSYSYITDLPTIFFVQEQGKPLMQLEPGLVVPRLQRPVVAQDLVDDGQHVVRAGTVVGRRVAAAAARAAHRAVVLYQSILLMIGRF